MSDEKPMPDAPFTHVAIDANALYGNHWPSPSAELDNLVLSCNQVAVPVLVPELVLSEAETVWFRRTKESIKAADDKVGQASNRLPHPLRATAVKWPAPEELRQSFRDAAKVTLDRWKVQRVPVPSVSLEAALERAVLHEPPFHTEDANFRDSVIFWSLLDAVPKGSLLAILSADEFFSKRPIARAAADRGIELVQFKSVQAAWEPMEKWMKATAFADGLAELERVSALVQEAVEADRENLERYVRENLIVPENPPGVTGTIEAVHDVGLKRVAAAHVAFFRPDMSDGFAEVVLTIEVTLYRYAATNRGMRAGQGLEDVSAIQGTFERTIAKIEAAASVDLTIEWSGAVGASAPALKYAGVTFGTPVQRLASMLAR